MRPEFFAIQLVGAAISLIGAASLAALPLPDYRWYNRVAVVVGLGFCMCLVSVGGLVAVVRLVAAHRPVDPLGFALGSLALGLPMIAILYLSIHSMHDLYPRFEGRYRSAVKLISIGIAAQLVPPLLGLVGVRLW